MKKEGVIVAWVVTGLLGFAAGLLIRWSPGGLPEAGDGPLLRVPAKGDPAAAVVLEEFSDFQCPFCARLALDSLRQVRDRYGDRVLLRFHHFPLRSHRMALPAARAAMAASLQGRFWEMHDRLFEQGKDLSEEVLVALARQAGLDTARFLWDLEDPRVEAHVQADADLSRALGLRGAPTLFVNGHMLMGAQPFEDLAARIDAELEAVAALRAEGVPAAELYRRRAEANGASEAFLSHVVEGTPVAPPEKKKSPGTGSDGREALIPATRWKVTVSPGEPSLGPADAPLTLVVFSDFECPYSRKATGFLREVLERFPGEVRVVYRNNPLSFHPGARPAAEAALAAHAQGRFWEMHDALYNHQDQLDASQIEGYAAALELDLDRFRGDVAARRFAAAVDADLVAAATLGVQGTPNIFVNGRLLRGARDLEEVEEVLAEELSRGQALRKQGIEDVHQHLTRDGRVFTPLDEEVFAFDTASSPARGAGPGAAVEIVLFSDFQCPYCARINSALEEVVRRDPGRVRLVFKQFPLAFHEHARAAAAASLAAHEQGRFWEMHDLLFGDAQHLDRESLEARAARLGLDLDAFRAALDGDRYRERLEADMDEGRRAGVRGTPTFFINGRRYDAPGRAADDIRKVIDTLTGDR